MATESSRYPKVTAFLIKWVFSFVATTVGREFACILRLCGFDNQGDVCTLFATSKFFKVRFSSVTIFDLGNVCRGKPPPQYCTVIGGR